MQRKGLGKGLSDLISTDALKQGATLLELRPHEIEPNPFQPRTAINDDELEELTRSIERHGVVQPLVVRPAGTGYQLVTGERRWRAAQRAGLTTVPCLVRDTSDSQTLQIALVENLQREDLNAMDAARGYHQLVTEFGISPDQVASVLGKSRSTVANSLRLLELPESVQSMVEMRILTEGHARALLPLADVPEELEEAADFVANSGMSVRETEEHVRAKMQPSTPHPVTAVRSVPEREARTSDPNVIHIEDRLQRALGTKVRLRLRRRGGTINIVYRSNEELERIIAVLDPPVSSRFGDFD